MRLAGLLIAALLITPAWGQTVKVLGVKIGDVIEPGTIIDLAASSPTSSSCLLSWTAPHEDLTAGGAVVSYDCRTCTQATCGTTMSDAEYTSATTLTGEPSPPATPGTAESFTAGSLSASTPYVFACKSRDEAPNISAISTSAICSTASPSGTANVLNETFSGTGYSDADWTSDGSGVKDPDENNASSGNCSGLGCCGTGTGWSGDCLELSAGTFDDPRATNAFAAQTGDVWLHARHKMTFVIATDGNTFDDVSLSNSTSPHAPGSIRIDVRRSTGPIYSLRLLGGDGGTLDSTTVASGDQLCIEMHVNNTTNVWEWWVNGTSLDSGIDGTLAIDYTNVWLGEWTQAISLGDSFSEFWDEVQVSNDGRLPCN